MPHPLDRIDLLLDAERQRNRIPLRLRASRDALQSISDGDGASMWPTRVDGYPISHDAALDGDGWRVVVVSAPRRKMYRA